MAKIRCLSTGNEACGEGAVRAGCRFYAGYPITPQNELTAYMSVRMEEENGVFIQAESELAAVNMVFGASAAGARAMTTSSSPGISLKQEGISYLAGNELPAVIVNVMRGGPGLGNIAPAQGDYFQATRGGGHGDYRTIVVAPATVQEMFDHTYLAFSLADRYRIPVLVLADGLLGQMMEPLEFEDDMPPAPASEKKWALTGARGRPAQSLKSLYLADGALEELNDRLQQRYALITREETRVEEYMAGDADICVVAYGSTARIARSAVDMMRVEGKKAGLIRPVTLWPFPSVAVARASGKGKALLVVEMSAGQMVEDVRLSAGCGAEIGFLGRTGGGIPREEDIMEKAGELLRAREAKRA